MEFNTAKPVLVRDDQLSDAGVVEQTSHLWVAVMHAGRDLVDHLSCLLASRGTGGGEPCCLPFQIVFLLRRGDLSRDSHLRRAWRRRLARRHADRARGRLVARDRTRVEPAERGSGVDTVLLGVLAEVQSMSMVHLYVRVNI